MKVTTKQVPVEDKNVWKFPCLGESKTTKQIVLFSSNGIGTVIKGTVIKRGGYNVGYWGNAWIMDHFTPCLPGFQVILEND